MDDTFRREREIFEACLALPATSRIDYLRRAAGEDSALASRVERLLQSHQALESGGEGTPRGPAEPVGEQLEAAPTAIGSYRIRERIGEGGMGVVYAAEQTQPVRRRVALKVIKLGMDTKEVIARFESERQALALMNHPGIARILDAGSTELGRPYFVMEYVPGIPLVDFCDQRRLDVRARLRLFVAVCEAIQHAHQKGVIHRDIKPSNILVSDADGQPGPKVIDFGIAKATNQRLSDLTVHTALGHFLGTPEYTSPEQSELTPLDVDTRSDVYSLGVVLYELLTGSRPLELRDAHLPLDEIQRRIRDEDPQPPSSRVTRPDGDGAHVAAARGTSAAALSRALRGELDWIVQKALAKDPARRYQTAQALADDVQRHLAGEPVHASPPTTAYRLRVFVRRHRLSLSVAAALFIALTVGLVAAWVGFLRVREERNAAREAHAAAEAVTDFLVETLGAVDPIREGRDVTVQEMLDAAASTAGERFGDRPIIEARLQGTIAAAYESLGRHQAAAPHFRRRLELYEELLAPGDRLRLHAENELGMNHLHCGHHEEALAVLTSVLDKKRRFLGGGHAETGFTMNDLAGALQDVGRWAEAEELLEEALEIHQRTLGESARRTLITLNNLAALYQALGRYEEAHELQIREYEATRRSLGDGHPETLISLQNVGLNYAQRGYWEKAEPLLEEALAGFRSALGDEHLTTLSAMQNLGFLRARHDQLPEARALLSEAVQLLEGAHGAEHPDTLHAMHLLATFQLMSGMDAEAEELLDVTLERAARVLTPDSTNLAAYRTTYGACLIRVGRLDEAEAALERALPTLESGLAQGVESLRGRLVQALGKLVELHELLGEPDEAARYGRARALASGEEPSSESEP